MYNKYKLDMTVLAEVCFNGNGAMAKVSDAIAEELYSLAEQIA